MTYPFSSLSKQQNTDVREDQSSILLKMYFRKSQEECFIVDSFLVKAYENHKSFRAKIFRGKEFHGYTASKKQYFLGLRCI